MYRKQSRTHLGNPKRASRSETFQTSILETQKAPEDHSIKHPGHQSRILFFMFQRVEKILEENSLTKALCNSCFIWSLLLLLKQQLSD